MARAELAPTLLAAGLLAACAATDPEPSARVASASRMAYVLLGGPRPTLSAGSSVESLPLRP